jgi:hypothetical protein
MPMLNHMHDIIERAASGSLLFRERQRYAVLKQRSLVVIEVRPERVTKAIQFIETRLTPPYLLTG